MEKTVNRTPRLWAGAAATALLLATGAAQAAASGPAAMTLLPAPRATLAALTQAVGGRGATQSPARYAYLRKLDGHLQDVALGRSGDAPADVYVSGDVVRAAADLRALGMRVDAVSDHAPSRVVEGVIPAGALAQAAALPETRAILPILTSAGVGSVTSEGDGAIFGPQARALGPTGAGVSVGIVSDSINQSPVGGVAISQGSGNLPANVQDLIDQPGGTDEGRAMAEIVYDEAPGLSSIAFASGTLAGAAAKAASIDTLVSHGVNVIADDIGILGEPFFQDGIVAQAVDRAHAAGVAYFSAAGNDARNAWEGTYSGGPSEDFDPGATVDTMQSMQVPAGFTVTFVLQWAEPWGGAKTDFALDVYQVGPGPLTLLGTSNDDNIATGIPEEGGSIAVTSSDTTLGLVIRRVAGSGNPFMKVIAFTNGPAVTMEHPVSSGTISPDASSAAGALTVAASPFATPTTPETFSSRGPVTHFFDAGGAPLATPEVRQKPELAAPDGVMTSLPGFAHFSGTSAAAPAAAGIAALILSAKPAMNVDELYTIMTTPANALPCTPPAADCGAGFVLANHALQMALDSTPPVITPTIVPATPDGAHDWYRTPLAVTWNVSDAESPVIHPSGCDAAALSAPATLTCSATSAGGTASVPLTIKVDETPPTAPVLAGIGAQTYAPSTLPKASSIRCSASDPISGVDSCVVTGFTSAVGAHTLTAVATNDAGLQSRSTLVYKVEKPAAVTRLGVAKGLTPARLANVGLLLTVRVAARSTRLLVKLVISVPGVPGKATAVAELRVSKRVPAGTARLRLRLTPKAKSLLRGAAMATLKITVSGNSSLAKPASVERLLVVRR